MTQTSFDSKILEMLLASYSQSPKSSMAARCPGPFFYCVPGNRHQLRAGTNPDIGHNADTQGDGNRCTICRANAGTAIADTRGP